MFSYACHCSVHELVWLKAGLIVSSPRCDLAALFPLSSSGYDSIYRRFDLFVHLPSRLSVSVGFEAVSLAVHMGLVAYAMHSVEAALPDTAAFVCSYILMPSHVSRAS